MTTFQKHSISFPPTVTAESVPIKS